MALKTFTFQVCLLPKGLLCWYFFQQTLDNKLKNFHLFCDLLIVFWFGVLSEIQWRLWIMEMSNLLVCLLFLYFGCEVGSWTTFFGHMVAYLQTFRYLTSDQDPFISVIFLCFEGHGTWYAAFNFIGYTVAQCVTLMYLHFTLPWRIALHRLPKSIFHGIIFFKGNCYFDCDWFMQCSFWQRHLFETSVYVRNFCFLDHGEKG